MRLFPYILFEKYINILALKMASQGNRHRANCIGNNDRAITIWSVAVTAPKNTHALLQYSTDDFYRATL